MLCKGILVKNKKTSIYGIVTERMRDKLLVFSRGLVEVSVEDEWEPVTDEFGSSGVQMPVDFIELLPIYGFPSSPEDLRVKIDALTEENKRFRRDLMDMAQKLQEFVEIPDKVLGRIMQG